MVAAGIGGKEKDMTREDIEEAARKESGIWAPGPVHLQDIYRRDDFEAGFCVGAEWRINSVWHDSTEKPMPGQLLLVRTLYGGYDLCYYGEYVWNTVMTWAYVKDLIPNTEE